jgi:hypothetical protein
MITRLWESAVAFFPAIFIKAMDAVPRLGFE